MVIRITSRPRGVVVFYRPQLGRGGAAVEVKWIKESELYKIGRRIAKTSNKKKARVIIRTTFYDFIIIGSETIYNYLHRFRW